MGTNRKLIETIFNLLVGTLVLLKYSYFETYMHEEAVFSVSISVLEK